MIRNVTYFACFALFATVVGCGTGPTRDRFDTDNATPPEDQPQPIAVKDAYAAAHILTLPVVAPEAPEGLENVFTLSRSFISGGEPKNEAAFRELAARGVRTIVSVDGKAPDVELARKHGMRYVHIPIQYKDVTNNEVLELSKTFREMQPPFYVHCFHGRHRGPAAAAVGRLALDGVPREKALAEMRQYSGTSKKYSGLYQAVATREIPSRDETESCSFAFPEQVKFGGIRDAMIPMPRAHDNLKMLAKNDFEVSADHPDIDPVNEATMLAEIFSETNKLGETKSHSADFRKWMDESTTQSRRLVHLLKNRDKPEMLRDAKAMLAGIGKTCNACHKVYRN